jgi:hypothetical protein
LVEVINQYLTITGFTRQINVPLVHLLCEQIDRNETLHNIIKEKANSVSVNQIYDIDYFVFDNLFNIIK